MELFRYAYEAIMALLARPQTSIPGELPDEQVAFKGRNFLVRPKQLV